MNKPTQSFLFFSFSLMALFVSCQQTDPSAKKISDSTEKQIDTSTAVHTKPDQNKYIEVKSWLDDFKNFRMALYHQDTAKMKTYFSFPIKDENRELWDIIAGMKGESAEHQKSHPGDEFTEQDFNANYKQIFTPQFLPGMLKIKSEKLYTTGKAETTLMSDDNRSYRAIARFDEESQQLALSINFYNGYDEKGNYVSEGEYSVIYIFKIIDHKKMLFDRLITAG